MFKFQDVLDNIVAEYISKNGVAVETEHKEENLNYLDKLMIDFLNGNEDAEKQKIEYPPNCYIEGKISAYAGTLSYEKIYRYTSCELAIHSDGARFMSCEKCNVPKEYNQEIIGKNMKELACGECRRNGGLSYIDWCNTNLLRSKADVHEGRRGLLYHLGLQEFVNKSLSLGFDTEKELLIFPLNHNQYVTLGFNGRNFTQSKEECKKVLAHYNFELVPIGQGKLKPLTHKESESPAMPYLDNRFYGTNGEIVIAGAAAYPDNGFKACQKGELILPYFL